MLAVGSLRQGPSARQTLIRPVPYFKDLEPVALWIAKRRVLTPVLADNGTAFHTGIAEPHTFPLHTVDNKTQLDGISVRTTQKTRIPEGRRVEELDTHIAGPQRDPVHHRD